jgi:uncharacterized phiE125 gp8 family phage protein
MAQYMLTIAEVPVSAAAQEPVDSKDIIGSPGSFSRDPSDDETRNLDTMIPAARRITERDTGRQLITATWRFKANRFPPGRAAMYLPSKSPWQSLFAFSYLDSAGVSQTLTSADYRFDAESGRIEPAADDTWPVTDDVIAPVTIDVVCGFGLNPSDVPADYRQVICAIVLDWLESRAMRFMVTPGVREQLDGLRHGRLWG